MHWSASDPFAVSGPKKRWLEPAAVSFSPSSSESPAQAFRAHEEQRPFRVSGSLTQSMKPAFLCSWLLD